MKLIKAPNKPFSNYKWRWAVVTPTESLNEPPVFLGVLRVFDKYDGYAPSSNDVLDGLQIVQNETKTRVNLVRTPERNLLRNSGQYWKAFGLLNDAHGKILVSPFGKLLASGKITQVEFATTVVKTLELPNRNIENTSDWDNIGLTIKPLELILKILSSISNALGSEESYISLKELIRIIIPLAGVKASLNIYISAIYQSRNNFIDISRWPDCTPSSNDVRMAREFLTFLVNYGFCKKINSGSGYGNERYALNSISKDEIKQLQKTELKSNNLVKVVKQISLTQIPAIIERKRVSIEILSRPYQYIFRKNVLKISGAKCLITGVNIENVLEASHIIPISENGSDEIENGLCLRSDVHQLFDSGHLKLFPNGELILSDIAALPINYRHLPKRINLPKYINKLHLDWRVKYY